MSSTANHTKGGEFATARKGGLDALDYAFVRTKRAAGVSDFAIANMIGRPIATVRSVDHLATTVEAEPAPVVSLSPPLPAPLGLQLSRQQIARRMKPSPKRLAADKKRWRETRAMPERIKALVKGVAERHGVTVADLIGDSRFAQVNIARHEAFALIRNVRDVNGAYQYPLQLIGRWFGNRDHATVRHGVLAHLERIAAGELREAA